VCVWAFTRRKTGFERVLSRIRSAKNPRAHSCFSTHTHKSGPGNNSFLIARTSLIAFFYLSIITTAFFQSLLARKTHVRPAIISRKMHFLRSPTRECALQKKLIKIFEGPCVLKSNFRGGHKHRGHIMSAYTRILMWVTKQKRQQHFFDTQHIFP
jgi:hypothetical protein